jgi:regulator of sirC expression with transglutaminase-like and TPR domain
MHAPSPAATPSTPRAPVSIEELAKTCDDEIDVARGAALIARDAYPKLDVDALLARFDELAAPLVPLDLGQRSADEQVRLVSEHIYVTLGFAGNETDYYDPKNSLLPDVIERRLGIPISLALVYVEIARRCGVVARGVGFPGHFLVRVDTAEATPVFVDPFFGGRALDRPALQRLLRRSNAPERAVTDDLLVPAASRSILTRMLVNLKWIYATRGDLARALLALDRLVSLTPDSVAALRERASLSARLGAVEAARADLFRLLELQPDAPDAGQLRAKLDELGAAKRTLN